MVFIGWGVVFLGFFSFVFELVVVLEGLMIGRIGGIVFVSRIDF